jgi:hypothetical protein
LTFLNVSQIEHTRATVVALDVITILIPGGGVPLACEPHWKIEPQLARGRGWSDPAALALFALGALICGLL